MLEVSIFVKEGLRFCKPSLVLSLFIKVSFFMEIQESVDVQCPTCFETIAVLVDFSAGISQEFIYDCEVCCRPMSIRIRAQSGEGYQESRYSVEVVSG